MATQEIINIGTLPNDGAGDPLRVAFGKINNNFSNLFATFFNTSNSYSLGNTPCQLIFETPASTITMGEMFIYTADSSTLESQTIKLSAHLNQGGNAVKFTGTGATFFGNALASYDMAVVDGNIKIVVNPLTEDTLFHFIGSQNLWTGANVMGLFLSPDGYDNSVLTTEDGLILQTEQGA